jgi:ryanodine receptor 2
VTLSTDLLALTERLARNNHDLWARRRLDEGWRYGPCRDDVRKEHPCLIPYEDLPEVEKAYDRTSVECVLRALLALGYQIRRD